MRPLPIPQARRRLPPPFYALLALLAALALPAQAEEFLPVRAAYQASTSVEAGRVVVRLEIAPDYYLYRDKLGFEPATPGVTFGKASLPVGVDHED